MKTQNTPSHNDSQTLEVNDTWASLKAKEKAAMQVSKEEVAEIIARSQRPDQSVHIRKATMEDVGQIYQLYKVVTRAFPDNILRQEKEITFNFVQDNLKYALERGYALVAEKEGQIVGYVKAFTSPFRRFAHILADTTLIIHPDYVHHSYGALLSFKGIEIIKNEMPHIQMLELMAPSHNKETVKLHRKLGCKLHGASNKSFLKNDGTCEELIISTFYNPYFNVKALQDYHNYLLVLLLKEEGNALAIPK